MLRFRTETICRPLQTHEQSLDARSDQSDTLLTKKSCHAPRFALLFEACSLLLGCPLRQAFRAFGSPMRFEIANDSLTRMRAGHPGPREQEKVRFPQFLPLLYPSDQALGFFKQ
jgi:hypothetical protein